jgi:hypothetical protein
MTLSSPPLNGIIGAMSPFNYSSRREPWWIFTGAFRLPNHTPVWKACGKKFMKREPNGSKREQMNERRSISEPGFAKRPSLHLLF